MYDFNKIKPLVTWILIIGGFLVTVWCICWASEKLGMTVLAALLVWITASYAYLTHKIVTAQKASLQAQVLTKLIDHYFSREMLKDMHLLLDFQRKHGERFDVVFQRDRALAYHSVKDVDIARRCCKSYFYELFFLLKTEIVTGPFVKKLVTPGSIGFFLDVIEPLERATNSNYEKDRFQLFRDLYKEELTEGKGKFKPPE